MAWIYFQELVESDSHSNLGSEQLHTVSENSTHKAYYCPECNQVKLTLPQSGMMSQHCAEKCSLKSTSSSEDFPVRISVLQNKIEKAWMDSEVVFSLKSSDLPKNVTPDLFFSKTSLPSEPLEQKQWLKNWPRSGMTVDGQLFQPPQLEPHTNAKDGSYWRTPNANDSARGPMSLHTALTGGHQISLVTQVKHPELWPKEADLQEIIGQLNPTFCEWLMGYRIGHTELSASVTAWFHSKSKRRSKS